MHALPACQRFEGCLAAGRSGAATAAQRRGLARNLAAHDYETDYALIAEHFNELRALLPVLVGAAARLLALSAKSLRIEPATSDFEAEFRQVCNTIGA